MDLPERVVLITGASSGIGAACARACARAGATVVLAARRGEELAGLVRELAGQGGRALAVPTDVSRRDEIEKLVAVALANYGRIDVLVNNAGVGGDGRGLMEVGDAQFCRRLQLRLS